jgi:hypothetical protein
MQDLARLQLFISRRLGGSGNCTVIPACDLLSGKNNTSPEEALVAFATWGAVHGSTANYTRMALSLVDSHFRRGPAAPSASRYRRSPASNLASKRRPSASHSCPDSPGAGPAEAATIRRGASGAEAGQRAAMAAERPLYRMPGFKSVH